MCWYVLFYLADNSKFDVLKYNTVINLYTIQPKSIQVGQLIVSSPESSTMPELNSSVTVFPRPPSIEHFMENLSLVKNDKKGTRDII